MTRSRIWRTGDGDRVTMQLGPISTGSAVGRASATSDERLPFRFVFPALLVGIVLSGVTMVAFLGTMRAG